MSHAASDRNLLFGILALQMDFIDREQLVRAMNAWVLDKKRPLGEILLEQQALSFDCHALLQALVEKHLQQHGDDAAQSLAAVQRQAALPRELVQLGDADVQASLAQAAATRSEDDDPEATRPAVGEPTAAGQRFRILRPHAQGGLGQVSVALDGELHRQVALKEIRPEYADDSAARGRFVVEAEITGGLEHPGVVPVYGLGHYPDGRPFYAMRFVQGDSLKEAVDRFHQAEQPGREAGDRLLALRQLLGRFVDVCQAVAYAHSRGVLHRDLKPGNILLGGYGETLVVDWGLAKLVGRSDGVPHSAEGTLRVRSDGGSTPTVLGQAIGTPAYMSPEQAVGRVDTLGPASDVYGLGATLYYLLTGRAPFARGDTGEVLRQVQKGDFPRPRQVKAEVPPALEAICVKAMALAPEARYASPGELAAEVERWLGDEPVAAYAEPLAQRAARWGRRHRPLLAGSAALAATALVALAIGLVVVRQEQQRTAAANSGLEQANAELAAEQQRTQEALKAESRRRQEARDALDAMSSEVVDEWLAQQKVLTAEQKKFLEKGLASYEKFAEDTGQDEAARAGVAGAFLRVGKIRDRLGQLREAEEAYRQSQRRYTQLAADFPAEPTNRQKLASTHDRLGLLLGYTGKYKEAEKEHRQALELQSRLTTDFPQEAAYRRDVAASHNHLGNLFHSTGRFREAEAAYRKACEILRRLEADFAAVAICRGELGVSQCNLGMVLLRLGRSKEGEEELRQAVALQQRLVKDFPTVPTYREGLARSHSILGLTLLDTGELGKAEPEYRDALMLQERLVADFPAVPGYRRNLAALHHNLATLLMREGRRKDAEPEFRTALALQERLAADFPAVPDHRSSQAALHIDLGTLLYNTDQPVPGEAEYRGALAILGRLAAGFPEVPDYQTELARCQYMLASKLGETGKAKAAEAEYSKLVPLLQSLTAKYPSLPLNRRLLGMAREALGEVLKSAGQSVEAETEFREAAAVQVRLVAQFPGNPDYAADLADTLSNLGQVLHARRDYQAARQALEEGLTHNQRALRANPKNPYWQRVNRELDRCLGGTLLELGDHAAASAAADRLARAAAASPATDRVSPQDPLPPREDLYRAACLLAQCVPLAEKDATLPASRRRELARQYAARAVAVFQQAIAEGYLDSKQAHEDQELDPLRPRPDFQKLLAQLKDRAQPK